jgi:Lrp/AsnC family leucine-responsive transcriptional regulator
MAATLAVICRMSWDQSVLATLSEQYSANVDDVDRSILATLEKHGRISNDELAARVGLTPSPCLRRVRRLEQTGVIRGYQALVDPAAVGRGLRVFAGVRLIRHARADVVAFEGAVIRLPEVVHTHHVTGNYDYLLQVEVADLSAYEDFHANRLANLPGVAAVTSYVTMKTLSPVIT